MKKWVSLLIVTAFVMLCLVPGVPGADRKTTLPSTVEEILSRHEKALIQSGMAARVHVMRLSGTIKSSGLEGTFELLCAPPARYLLTYDLGPYRETFGFDGFSAWIRDKNGVVRRTLFSEHDLILLQGMVWNRSYLDARRYGLQVTIAPPLAGLSFLRLAVPDGDNMLLGFNPESWLLAELRYTQVGTGVQVQLGEYRSVHGVPVPHRVKMETEYGTEELFQVKEVQINRDFDERLFLAPDSFRNVEFADEAVSVAVELKRIGNYIFAPVKIDGKDGGWFFIDTGAGATCIDSSLAKRLKMKKFGRVDALGVGGHGSVGFHRAGELRVGDLIQRDLILVGLDLSSISEALGFEVGGILGYDLWSQMPFTLDYDTLMLTLHHPDHFTVPAEVVTYPIYLIENIPTVQGIVEDRDEGLFRLDTGSGGSLDLHAPFVDAHQLLAGRELKEAQAVGYGGGQKHFSGQVSSFSLLGVRFDSTDTGFSQAEAGVFLQTDTAGNVGGGIISRFHLTFDYRHERLYLRLP